MKAFVSSTYEDLRGHRAFVVDALRNSKIDVVSMEDWAAIPCEPRQVSLDRIEGCDLFVLLVAFRRGFCPEGSAESITQLEYRYAVQCRIPVLAFLLKDDEGLRWPRKFDDMKTDPGVSEWRSILEKQQVLGYFDDRPESIPIWKSVADLRANPLHNDHPVHHSPSTKPRVSTERLPVDGGKLFGREAGLRELDSAWEQKRTNILCLIGFGGVGKTSLINAWLANLATENYRGAQTVFGWSFESQEADQQEASAETFLTEALKFFGEAIPPPNPTERARRLAQAVSNERAILILDGLEAMQHPREPHELKDQSVQVLLKMLSAQNQGLCLVSSRIEVFELKPSVGKMVKVIRVDELGRDAGTDLLRDLGVTGPEGEFKDAVAEYRGHALSLTLLGAYLRRFKHGDIRRRNELNLDEPADARRVIGSYEQWLGQGPEIDVLKILALFNRPVPIAALDAVRAAPAIPHLTESLVNLPRTRFDATLADLRDLKLVADPPHGGIDRDLDTHAIVRQHFAQQLRDRYPDAWREANGRLFEYYRRRPVKHQPDTLDEVADLFQAVMHGCRAGRHQEVFNDVYRPRIRRGEDGYSATTLNAWGADLVAVSNFFSEGDWERPLPTLDGISAARACTEAAFDLRGHGRIDEAIGAQIVGLRRHVDMARWWSACDAAGNLSELRTLNADIAEAEVAARQSIEFAGKAAEGAKDDEERAEARSTLSTNLATLGDVLHQRGQLVDAEAQFVQAERIYHEVKPHDRYLYLLRGYHYCDLLLTLGRLDEVEARAAFGADAASRAGRPYGVALAHLAMARRRTAIVQRGDLSVQHDALRGMEDACALLRQTGHSEMILRGLLASAELHRVTGHFDEARAELAEVLESATRVQMKLLEADAHLQLAYVEAATGNTSRMRVHLDLCRGVVQAFGYNRRDADVRALANAAEHGPTTSGGTTSSSAWAFAREQQQFVNLYLRGNPIEGTQLGIAGNHDSRLPPVDPRERADFFAELTASAHSLRAAAETTGDVDDVVDGELAVAGVRGMRIVEDALRPYARNPGMYLDGVVRGLYSLLARTDISVDQKVGPLTARLLATPDRLGRGQRQVSRSPRVLVDNAIGDAEGALQFLKREIGDFVEALPQGERKRDLEDARRKAAEAVEAFRRFVAGLTATATDEFALGRAAFDALLHDVHQVPYDADELGALGRRVVADLEASLERVSLKAAQHRRWWEVVVALESRYPTRASLLDEYRGVLEHSREFVQQHDLVDLNAVGPLLVKATPLFARSNLPFAAYIPAPPFASTGRGEFWVTPALEGIGLDEERGALRHHHLGRLLVSCVHEGYPGHHTQFEHAANVKRPLRHFFASTVFSEGWGLYCEHLMRREGFLLDGSDGPLLEISMLRDQLWRALRIVIDVGLHCKGMTREHAVALLVDKHVLNQDSAEAEVMYYCGAPTQPMSYMVGRILMEGVIEKCRAARGESSESLGKVRNEVLSHGSLPFPLLERVMGLASEQ